MDTWSVYLLRDENQSLYTGITTDVKRRLKEHVLGGARSAKYTRARKLLELAYVCRIGNRSLASKVEYRLKRLRKTEKEAIVSENASAGELLDRLDL